MGPLFAEAMDMPEAARGRAGAASIAYHTGTAEMPGMRENDSTLAVSGRSSAPR